MKIVKKIFQVLFVILILCSVSYFGYQQNWFDIHNQVVQKIRSNRVEINEKKILKTSNRIRIKKQLMRETQANLKKQGFVSVPSVGILEPIFNDAYSEKGLKAGANYANRNRYDPNGKQVPIMGKGNYGLASHNFDDGLTGFSGLQQNYKNDAPYIIDNRRQTNNWLNNKPIYLANNSGIYEYRIKKQKLVSADDVEVLNPTRRPRVTIITCLFPSTANRIITVGYLKKDYTWRNAPSRVVQYFDLTKQKTNAHVNWYNPGVEEGINGNAGGTKK